MTDDRTAHVRDPQVLRALAHPLRSRLLGLLRTGGPSTATRLGGQVGESSGSTSYHLRRLEAHGMVTEDHREGRERWWRAVHATTSWEPADLIAQPGGLEANEVMQRRQVEVMGGQLRTWLEHGRSFGTTWAGVSGMSDYALQLTPEQAKQCTDEVYAVLDRWAAQPPPADERAARVAFHTAVFPLPPA